MPSRPRHIEGQAFPELVTYLAERAYEGQDRLLGQALVKVLAAYSDGGRQFRFSGVELIKVLLPHLSIEDQCLLTAILDRTIERSTTVPQTTVYQVEGMSEKLVVVQAGGYKRLYLDQVERSQLVMNGTALVKILEALVNHYPALLTYKDAQYILDTSGYMEKDQYKTQAPRRLHIAINNIKKRLIKRGLLTLAQAIENEFGVGYKLSVPVTKLDEPA